MFRPSSIYDCPYLFTAFLMVWMVWMVGELKGKRWVSGVGVSFVPLIAARLAATSLSSAVVNFAPN